MLSGWYQSRHPVFPDSQFRNDRNLHSQSLNPSFNQTMKAFYLSLIFTLTLMLFSSCGEKPGQQNIDPIPESKPVSSSLDPIDRQPPTSPPTHGIVSRNGLYYKGSSETPFTGKYEEAFDDGKPRSSINFLNGQKDGVEKAWSETGTLLLDANFSGGKRHGTTKSWDETGQLMTHSNYLNGLLHGVSATWFSNGQKDTEAVHKFGKTEGKALSWHSSGEKASESVYANSQKHGIETQWNTDGKVTYQALFDNGQLSKILVKPEAPLVYPKSEAEQSSSAQAEPILEPPAPQEIRLLALDAVQVVVRAANTDKVLLSKSFKKDETVVLPMSGNINLLTSKAENLVLSKDGAEMNLDGTGILTRKILLKKDGSLEIQGDN